MFSKEEILTEITRQLNDIEDDKKKAMLLSLLDTKTNEKFSEAYFSFLNDKEEIKKTDIDTLNQAWIYRELCIWAKKNSILNTKEIADFVSNNTDVVSNMEVYENESSLGFPDDDWEEIKTEIQRRKESQPVSEDAHIASSPQPMSPSTSETGFELAYKESRHRLIDLLEFHRKRGHKGNKETASDLDEWEEIDLTDSDTQNDTQEIINENNNTHILEDSLFEVAQAIIKEADIEKERLIQLHQAGKIDTAILQSNMHRLTSTLNDTAVVLQDPTAPKALDALQNLQKNLPKQNEKMSTLTKIFIVLGVILAISVVVGILVGLSLATHGAILPAIPHILSTLHTVVLPYFTAAGPWAHIGALIQSGTAPALAAVKGFVTGPFIHFVSLCQANAMHFVYQPIAHASSSFAAQLYHGFHSPTFTFVGKIIGYSVAALVGMVALCFAGEAMRYTADSIFNPDDENNSVIDDASSEHNDESVYSESDNRREFDDDIDVRVTDDDEENSVDDATSSEYNAFMYDEDEDKVIVTPDEDLSKSNSLQQQKIVRAKQTVTEIRKQEETRTAAPSADNPEHKVEGMTHKPFAK